MNKQLEKETINQMGNEMNKIMSMKGMLTYTMLEKMLKNLSIKYDIPIIIRNKNVSTNKTTIKVIA